MENQLIHRILRRLSRCNYHLCKSFYLYELEQAFRRKTQSPILIYQMGKVGSSTVKKSLEQVSENSAIYHVHFLTKDLVSETEAKRKPYFRTNKHNLLTRPWMYQFLIRKIESDILDTKWKVISLTRDPIARNISAFFENLEITVLDSGQKFQIQSDIWDIEPRIIETHNIKELIDLFFDRFYHFDPMEFFDKEIKGTFGIDVYSTEFPTKKGYKIYANEIADILLLRMENLNQCVTEALGGFLGITTIQLFNENISNQKHYAALYRQFKKAITLPVEYVDQMYESRYMSHFYSDDEIKRFRSHWLRQ